MGVAAPDPTLAPAGVLDDLGTGTVVVLLHGIGFGPATLAPVASALARDARVLVVRRPAPLPGAALAHQAAATGAVVADHLGGLPYVVAGISGGATLALALAATDAPLLGVVAHEPLVGAAAPDLSRVVRASHAALAAGAVDPAAWFAGLVGASTWEGLGVDQRSTALAAHDDLVAEIRPFVDWEPTADEVAALRRVRVVTTVGERSGSARHRAADALRGLVGAAVEVLPGTGHLVQLEAPAAFADAVARLLAVPR